ncbi:hypothetical protein NDU88_005680 [Pleurodeles waltl]|uniref:Uncharacterized protein n=1 Tax=Pleurodeles waltl TaxID=8319 RepID=A0AAV7PJ99_PLEWA|nr:hypothetical protein NDU88_005680 [Pleurodeles waltl]
MEKEAWDGGTEKQTRERQKSSGSQERRRATAERGKVKNSARKMGEGRAHHHGADDTQEPSGRAGKEKEAAKRGPQTRHDPACGTHYHHCGGRLGKMRGTWEEGTGHKEWDTQSNLTCTP